MLEQPIAEPALKPTLDGAHPPDPADAGFSAVRHALTQPTRAPRRLPLMAISLVVFAAAQWARESSFSDVLLVVAVLALHEGGHFIGMRLFGYRDVRMFFVPFLGALTSGRSAAVAAWKEALVLLLGPIPGLLVSLGCLIWASGAGSTLAAHAAVVLLAINGFNLLPLSFLDGGKLFRRVLFSRHRYLELAFAASSAAALVAVAVMLQAWFLAVVAVLQIVALPKRARVLAAAAGLRRTSGAMEGELTDLPEPQLRALYAAAVPTVPTVATEAGPAASGVVAAMSEIVEALRPAPGIGASLLVLLVWLFGGAVALVGLVGISLEHHADWHTIDDAQAGFRVTIPRAEFSRFWPYMEATPTGQAAMLTSRVTLDFVRRFTVTYRELPRPLTAVQQKSWIDFRRDALAQKLGGKVILDERDAAGATGELVIANNDRRWRGRIVLTPTHAYEVFASLPESDGDSSHGDDAERFLRSFQPLPLVDQQQPQR